ncbi:MAG: hypothetical protein M0Z33_09165 [Actinomycetota bacterium]|nr:hypothetical protein [Actinomycetota bacterium]
MARRATARPEDTTDKEHLLPGASPIRVVRQARIVADLPARLDTVENRCSALEATLSVRFEEVRDELAQLRALFETMLETETDVATLVGRLLAEVGERVASFEDALARPEERGAAAPVADPGGGRPRDGTP